MSAVIDLPRIRRALSELDRIATEHPEICQGIGQWDEAAVEKIVTGRKPGKLGRERQAEYRRQQAAKGIKREIFFATPEAQVAFSELRAMYPGKSRDTILCDALIHLLAAQQTTESLTAINQTAALPDDSDTLSLFEPESTDSNPWKQEQNQ